MSAKPRPRRSSEWPKLRAQFLAANPACAACGSTVQLEVHHRKPVHLFPELELTWDNLITLCERRARNCHLAIGHALDWKTWNPRVRDLAKAFLAAVNARRG